VKTDWKTGDRLTLISEGKHFAGQIALASPCGGSLVIELFDVPEGSYPYLPVLLDVHRQVYRELIHGHPIEFIPLQ